MDRKDILFCYEAHLVGVTSLAGSDRDYKIIQRALEANHQVTTMPDLKTARNVVKLPVMKNFYDFAVLCVERSHDRSVASAMCIPRGESVYRDPQVASDLTPYVQSLQVIGDMKRAQPRMKVILYGSYNPKVVKACVNQELIDFYTRGRENGVTTLDDEIEYIQRCIAEKIDSRTSLSGLLA